MQLLLSFSISVTRMLHIGELFSRTHTNLRYCVFRKYRNYVWQNQALQKPDEFVHRYCVLVSESNSLCFLSFFLEAEQISNNLIKVFLIGDKWLHACLNQWGSRKNTFNQTYSEMRHTSITAPNIGTFLTECELMYQALYIICYLIEMWTLWCMPSGNILVGKLLYHN